jgi:hypothetical protein
MMPTTAVDKGILYVAIGEQMRRPLERSIASVRKHLDLPITLVTDLRDVPYVEALVSVDWEDSPSYAVKPAFIPELPYHRTMFLDADTVVMRPDAAQPLDLITQRYGYHAAAVLLLHTFLKDATVGRQSRCKVKLDLGLFCF